MPEGLGKGGKWFWLLRVVEGSLQTDGWRAERALGSVGGEREEGEEWGSVISVGRGEAGTRGGVELGVRKGEVSRGNVGRS